MGIDRTSLNAILMSCRHIKNKQNLLTIGRQQIHTSQENNIDIGDKFNTNLSEIIYGNYCETFFSSVGFINIDSIDNSNYEGSKYIHNLNYPILEDFKNKYDYIYDGGTSEHIFNIPQVFENIIDMLNIDGLFVSVTCNNNFSGHGMYQFSPELYLSCFNQKYGMEIIDMYIAEVGTTNNEWKNVNSFNGYRNIDKFNSTLETYIIIIARKISNERESLIKNSPNQYSYDEHDWKKYTYDINIFNIWHNKLFDECYDKLDDYSLQKITMYDVNQNYTKIFNKERKYNIVSEYKLDHYNSLYQDTNYCQTSCLYHVFKNKLYTNTNYIGFIQYDMELSSDFIYDMEQKINSSENDTYFYILTVANKVEVNYICKPYDNSILEKYNNYFNKSHTYESIKAHHKADKFICLHTFVIPTKTFINMMTWFCSITDWLHKNYINGLYSENMSEVTEEIFGLFLLLQIIEDETIELKELKLHHEWPNLHNNTSFINYKDNCHYFSLDKIVDNRFTDKNTTHSYLETYEKLLKDTHLSCKNVLEIGIQRGGSIKLWNDYFINANIYGIDIDEGPKFLEKFKRVKCLKMNAYSQDSIDYFSNQNIKFDFIIDDGPHTLESMIFMLIHYSKLLTPTGILIIEDIPSMEWAYLFERITNKYKENTHIYDLRENKGRYDDIVFTFTNSNIENIEFIDYNIEYGLDDNKINITHTVMSHSLNKEFIEIPTNDEVRATLYGDPCWGVVKYIYISTTDGTHLKFSQDHNVELDFNGFLVTKILRPESLTVYKSPYDKIRLGKDYDGGYIICDIPDIKYDFFLSGGILDDISFEEDFCSKYPHVKCMAYDGFIDNIDIKNNNITFIKQYIGDSNNEYFTNLHSIINQYNNIFIKMDIEGGEIPWINSLSTEQIDKFAQIVIEFHFPFYEKECLVFEKLLTSHVLVHFHANNCCGTNTVKNIKIPNVFECTYIHKKYYTTEIELNTSTIPGTLDMKNVLDKDEIYIDYPPFVH